MTEENLNFFAAVNALPNMSIVAIIETRRRIGEGGGKANRKDAKYNFLRLSGRQVVVLVIEEYQPLVAIEADRALVGSAAATVSGIKP